jgi:hypothetical protein
MSDGDHGLNKLPVRPPRDEKGRILKGHSLNPAGRPKGLRAKILEETREGDEIVEFYLAVMRGELPAPPAVRLQASEWLALRSHGKVPDVNVNADLGTIETPADLGLTLEDLRSLARAPQGELQGESKKLATSNLPITDADWSEE